MSDDFIDFSYGFIYKCANLIHNLYDYNDYCVVNLLCQ